MRDTPKMPAECEWPTCECALDPDKCKVQSVEPAPAQDELRKRFDEIEFEVAQGKHTAASVFTQMRTAAMYIRPAQTEQQPDGEAVEIVASAIDGPCREVESIDDMAQIICGQLAEAGFLRVRKSEAANFAAPIAGVLCRFGLSRDDAEALGAELAIALIPHLAQWDEDHHAAPIAQTAPQPEQSGLPDPRQWTDQQVLDFLGVALRNVDVVGTVHLNEIRQGFELVMGRPSLPDQGGARE